MKILKDKFAVSLIIFEIINLIVLIFINIRDTLPIDLKVYFDSYQNFFVEPWAFSSFIERLNNEILTSSLCVLHLFINQIIFFGLIYIPVRKPKKFTFIYLSIVFILIVIRLIPYNTPRLELNTSSNCGAGNEGCITKVREHFSSSGKTILGEEYLGNGKFGISFMDSQHPGAYNAKVETDCNCNVTDVNISTIR